MARRPHRLFSRLGLIGVAAAAALAVAACAEDEGEPAQPAGTTVAAETTTATTDPPGTESTQSASTESTEDAEPAATDGELFPDVIAAEAEQDNDGSWTVSATLSSPYDTPERYADAWRVLDPDGTELGIRVLLHDHGGEQPFTRSQSGIEIPDDVDVITVQGRDQVSGWGGATVEIELAR